MLIPPSQYSVHSVGVRPSRGRLQKRPNLRCCLLCSSLGVRHEGTTDGSGDPPHHVVVVARALLHERTLTNQPDGVWGHPERAREALQLRGDRFQGLEGMKL